MDARRISALRTLSSLECLRALSGGQQIGDSNALEAARQGPQLQLPEIFGTCSMPGLMTLALQEGLVRTGAKLRDLDVREMEACWKQALH